MYVCMYVCVVYVYDMIYLINLAFQYMSIRYYSEICKL